jgi:hypothetical protein
MYQFLMNVDNEEFHYLSFDDLYQITSISIQNQSKKVTMMMLAEYRPIHTSLIIKKIFNIICITLLHNALHGMVYNLPEYEPQTQISS